MADWSDITVIGDALTTVRDELYAMRTAVNFNISEFSVDEKSRYDLLRSEETRLSAMYEAAGGSDILGGSTRCASGFATSNDYGDA